MIDIEAILFPVVDVTGSHVSTDDVHLTNVTQRYHFLCAIQQVNRTVIQRFSYTAKSTECISVDCNQGAGIREPE